MVGTVPIYDAVGFHMKELSKSADELFDVAATCRSGVDFMTSTQVSPEAPWNISKD